MSTSSRPPHNSFVRNILSQSANTLSWEIFSPLLYVVCRFMGSTISTLMESSIGASSPVNGYSWPQIATALIAGFLTTLISVAPALHVMHSQKIMAQDKATDTATAKSTPKPADIQKKHFRSFWMAFGGWWVLLSVGWFYLARNLFFVGL